MSIRPKATIELESWGDGDWEKRASSLFGAKIRLFLLVFFLDLNRELTSHAMTKSPSAIVRAELHIRTVSRGKDVT